MIVALCLMRSRAYYARAAISGKVEMSQLKFGSERYRLRDRKWVVLISLQSPMSSVSVGIQADRFALGSSAVCQDGSCGVALVQGRHRWLRLSGSMPDGRSSGTDRSMQRCATEALFIKEGQS